VLDLSVDHLYRHPDHLPLVASWIHGAFWTHSGRGVDAVVDLLREATDPGRIPLSLLARIGREPAGTVNLIACDSKARPDLTPWLAALFVESAHRGKGVGAELVRRLIGEAARLRFTEMFLETDIPEFYARLGATRFEALADGGWIMRIPVAP
jgi:predicted N-acetyltransferase YhbS